MKKLFLSVLMVSIAGLIIVESGSAQLINYERRNKNLQKDNASAKTTAENAKKQVDKMIDPEVVSRVERIYDVNNDGRLQEGEINELYGDVVSNVYRRGSFRVTEGVLKKFDRNDDNNISRYELDAIERAMQ